MFEAARVKLVALIAIAAGALVFSGGCAGRGPAVQADSGPVKVEIVEQHWPNGKLRLRKEVVRKPDGTAVDHGTYVCWYDNGQKEYEATFVEGKLHGIETTWHRNGQKRTEQHYKHGLRHGPRYAWDEAGRKRKEEHYLDDQPHGTWTTWREDGTIRWQGTFDHGVPGR